MEKILKYSVLRYSPSVIVGEKINLGIVFSAEEDEYRAFKYPKSLSRLSNFDDEIDTGIVKKLLRSIEEEVVGTLFNYGKFDIEAYTKHYVNDFAFDRPKSILYEDLDKMVEKLNKMYFRFEYDKKERPSKEDDKRIIEKLISASNKAFKKNEYELGASDENIRFDFITDDYKIKIFDFDGKDLARIISTAKSWAWNCLFNEDKKIIIIYRYNNEEKRYAREFNSIMDIFNKAGAEIYSIDDGLQMLQNHQN